MRVVVPLKQVTTNDRYLASRGLSAFSFDFRMAADNILQVIFDFPTSKILDSPPQKRRFSFMMGAALTTKRARATSATSKHAASYPPTGWKKYSNMWYENGAVTTFMPPRPPRTN